MGLMGTRHLVAVYCDGEYRVAQYGQWDGYPEGAGLKVLEFANKISNVYDKSVFREKLLKCGWVTAAYISELNAKIKAEGIKEWQKMWPEFSRDTGADILNMIYESDGMLLENEIDFAADSLFCEWAWVIDLDKGTFEGYKGFNKKPLSAWDRFYFLRDKEDKEFEDGKYHGVRIVKAYSLFELPPKAVFLSDFAEDDEDGEV